VIANIYDEELVAEFDSALIVYGRVGAGTTGIHNACDRALTFRETKKAVRKIRTNQVDLLPYHLRSRKQSCPWDFRNFLCLCTYYVPHIVAAHTHIIMMLNS
jgi:hypothetical protein